MTSMHLANLAKIGQLEPVPLAPALIQRILAGARQQLKDSLLEQASNETRFDCAYNVIRAAADIGLLMNRLQTVHQQARAPSDGDPGARAHAGR